MLLTPTRLLAMALATGGILAAADAQQIPLPEGGPAIVNTSLVDGQIEMRDSDTGAALMLPKTLSLWDDKDCPTSIAPSIEIQSQPAGYDAIYTFTNNTKSVKTLGALNAGILTLGSKVSYPDIRDICQPLSVDCNDNFKTRQIQYPQTAYSPAWVLQNHDYAVGVSIQYPILDYKHDVRVCLYSPQGRFAEGEGGRGWRVEFLLSNSGNETPDNKLYNSGSIAPGETQTYVVSVRVTKKPDEWVRTLVPYRNWFRSQYGNVEYTRDPRPINGRNFTNGPNCSDTNPYGYGVSRPDINGWGAIVGNLMERSGWGTLLFYTPSGSYRVNTQNNMPFQFTSNWNATKPLATAYDPKIGFPRLPAAGQQIGFWWGRSCQIANKWDDSTLEPFNPNNKDHRAAALKEMDLAAKAGATTIGLDTFSSKYTPVWDLITWLDDLKARYPGMRFCAEPVTCDLIHRKIATYYRGNNDRYRVEKPEDIDGYTNPHYLADFLLPGHEIWGSFRWCQYEEWFGITFTEDEMQAKLQQIASLGYVPVCLTDINLTVKADAAKSWEYTVPPDLREDGNGGNGDNGGNGGGGDNGNNDNNGGGGDGTINDGGQGGQDVNPGDPFPTFDLFDKAFNAGDSRADLNADGKLDFFDYTAWQNAHAGNGNGNNNVQGGNDGGQGTLQVGSGVHTVKNNARAGRSRMKISVSQAPKGPGGIVGSAGDAGPAEARRPANRIRPRDFFHTGGDFTQADIDAALARLRGEQTPDATTAGVPDNN